jgi:hypothetical protein
MHQLKSMDRINWYYRKTSEVCMQVVAKYVPLDDIDSVIYFCLMGLELTAYVNTNYIKVGIICHQLKTQRLSEWYIFCDWIRLLSLAQITLTHPRNIKNWMIQHPFTLKRYYPIFFVYLNYIMVFFINLLIALYKH